MQIIIVPWIISFITICAVLPPSTTTGDDRVDVARGAETRGGWGDISPK